MLRIGILGAANIAPNAIIYPAARRNDCEITALASRRPEAAKAFAETHGIPRVHESYQALLDDPGIDLVYNALPPSAHAPLSIAALKAGKHVLCEKPFALNGKEAEQMVATAEAAGKRLIEAFHDRYHPVFLHLLSLRDSGALGPVTRLEAEFSVAIPYREGELRHRPELGGGALMDLGCYPVHWLRALMQTEPEVKDARGHATATGVDEDIEADLIFAGNVPARIVTRMAKGTPYTARLIVEAGNGRVEIDNPILPHQGHSVREWLGTAPFREHTLGGGTTYDFQLDAIVKGLQTGSALPTEGADPIGNMTTIDAIYQKAGFAR